MGGWRAVEAHAGLDAKARVEVVGHLGEVVAGGLDTHDAGAALGARKAREAHPSGRRKGSQAVKEPLGESELVPPHGVDALLAKPSQAGGQAGDAWEVGGAGLKAVGHEGGHLLAV